MKIEADSPADYISKVPPERQSSMKKLRSTIRKNLPKGFKEEMSYGMIGYVVPHSIYPDGYHCDPTLPVPFMNIASQKNFIALYHSGLYANPELHQWFVTEYPKHSKYKLDMGKSCVRFKKIDDIPFELIGELVRKMTLEDYMAIYNSHIKK